MDARVEEAVQQPLKVIADSRWRTPPQSRILAGSGAVMIAGDDSLPAPVALNSPNVKCLQLPVRNGRVDLPALLRLLAEMEINEVQVEAGAVLCGALLKESLVDEILIYQAPVLLGDGGPGPFALGPLESMAKRTHLTVLETTHFGHDLRVRLKTETRH
jgi:diaminohydroxyphosphoribosylaminopyrimidine deaminase/5-amino-6-(5-phosphoribosylamino)uracil reductase